MKIISLFFISFLSLSSYAQELKKCHQYKLEGFFEKKKEHILFTVNKDSQAAIQIHLGKFLKDYETYNQINIGLEIQIESNCLFQCKGKILKIGQRISPFDLPNEEVKLLKTKGCR